MGRASKIRGRGAERHQRCDSGPKGLRRKAVHNLSSWRRRSGPSAPSTSLFFCLLDVRESRGAPRSCLGGPAFDPSVPSAATAGPVRSISHSWYLSRFSSRASRKKRAALNCCCRHHKRSGGPTVPDLNRLGLKHGLIARRFRTIKVGTPPGHEVD